MTLPRKLYLETTTRCNLSCSKCIKQIDGSRITETDFPYVLFEKLLPSLCGIQTLVLNGIGEPLLHPDLPRMITAARSVMGENATIGFQTNGVLLTPEKSVDLISSGLSEICLSLDSLQGAPSTGQTNLAPAVTATAKALANLKSAIKKTGSPLRIGLEIVLSKNNIEELPDLVHWAAVHGVHFILATHLFAYNQTMATESVFEPNTESALTLYNKYRQAADSIGIDLDAATRSILSSKKMVWDEQTASFFKQMRNEAATLQAHLHFSNLLDHDDEKFNHYQTLFNQAQEIATSHGIDIRLPQLQAQEQRICQFMEDEAVFINTSGDVMPCHFLWHSYPCMGGNNTIMVHEHSFGNIEEKQLEEIWQAPDYKEFRRQAVLDDYANCWSCPQSPCEDLVNANILGINDCFGSNVPCGHCRWSIGGLHCL